MIPAISDIQTAVARFYGVPLREMTSHRRERSAAHARQVGMYLARELTPHSYPVIGRHFGKRDHTTVMFGIRQVERRIGAEPETRLAVDGLCAMLRADAI